MLFSVVAAVALFLMTILRIWHKPQCAHRSLASTTVLHEPCKRSAGSIAELRTCAAPSRLPTLAGDPRRDLYHRLWSIITASAMGSAFAIREAVFSFGGSIHIEDVQRWWSTSRDPSLDGSPVGLQRFRELREGDPLICPSDGADRRWTRDGTSPRKNSRASRKTSGDPESRRPSDNGRCNHRERPSTGRGDAVFERTATGRWRAPLAPGGLSR